jgi:hypothetical protein
MQQGGTMNNEQAALQGENRRIHSYIVDAGEMREFSLAFSV